MSGLASPAAEQVPKAEKPVSDPFETAADLARNAETVIIVPGYGMAVAQAQFEVIDLCFVIGACDVVNPAAMETDGSPISGMPILRAYEAKAVVVCNFDANPGYSGVDNTLYADPKTIMLQGDAAATARDLIAGVKKAQ